MTRNVGSVDEGLRTALGTVLVVWGLSRRRVIPTALGLVLLYTAGTHYCPLNEALGVDTFRYDEPTLPGTDKPVVQEASEESFPASDPPSWTTLQ